MSEFATVGTGADLSEGEMRAFEVGGRRVTVGRVGGNLHAFDDTCTHRQRPGHEAHLHEGLSRPDPPRGQDVDLRALQGVPRRALLVARRTTAAGLCCRLEAGRSENEEGLR